ncbi:hypothetical protein F5X96DRAFT_690443 [Biscogniauxia mediterranea]|nr:hypothetical protein F5X96DRAFT_690443 [Biscogniauxia mediterranea]
MAANPNNESMGGGSEEPSIAFLLQSQISSPGSTGGVPKAQKSSSPPSGAQASSSSDSPPTWDLALTEVDWTQLDWRNYGPLNVIPWGELSINTINYLAGAWDAYDTVHHPEVKGIGSNPASAEQLRRFATQNIDQKAKDQTAKIMRLFTTNPPGLDRPEDVLGVDPNPPKNFDNNNNNNNNNNDPQGKDKKDADGDDEMKLAPDDFYTIGFEIEFLVAVTPANGGPDPHQDGRWLDMELTHDPPTSIKFLDRVTRAVADALNAEAGIVVTIKDEDEEDPMYRIARERLDALAAGEDPAAAAASAAPASPSPQPAPDHGLANPAAVARVVDVSVAYAQTAFFRADENMRLHQATHADIDRLVGRLSDTGAVVALEPGDLVAAVSRARRRLRVLAHQAQRDPLAVDLPGMKHRYRAWSVSEARYVRPDGVRAAHYTNVPGAPGGNAPRPPVDAYKWATLKLSSPAMSGHEVEPISAALERACRTLRARFRAHRDLPAALPLTAQVSASHTRGFALVELKKLATLVRLLEAGLRRLHRAERADPAAWRACGSFATWTALGGASVHDADWLLGHPGAPAWRALPRPAPATRAVLEADMERHLPTAEMFAAGREAEEVFYRGLWLYTSVEQLSRGLAADRPGIRPAVVFKCAGRGQHTAADRDEIDDERRPLPFVEVDRERGVVEFRYMQQSLEPFHLLCWGAVCARLVSVAKDTDASQFRDILVGVLRGRSIFDVLDVPDRFADGFKQGIARSDTGFFEYPDKGRVDYSNIFWDPM